MVQVLNLIIFVYIYIHIYIYICVAFIPWKHQFSWGDRWSKNQAAQVTGISGRWVSLGRLDLPRMMWNGLLCRFSRLFWEVSWDHWCSCQSFFLWINIGWNWMIDDYGICESIINEQYSDIQQWVIIPTAMQNPSGWFTKKMPDMPGWLLWSAGIEMER